MVGHQRIRPADHKSIVRSWSAFVAALAVTSCGGTADDGDIEELSAAIVEATVNIPSRSFADSIGSITCDAFFELMLRDELYRAQTLVPLEQRYLELAGAVELNAIFEELGRVSDWDWLEEVFTRAEDCDISTRFDTAGIEPSPTPLADALAAQMIEQLSR
ncbi:hypothetical protein M0534_05255 [Methylonatrum kenyense]|uniref:hypothetical protein n=1 Tax=Methylonatrum kenyense TaxID=455253 RepID=UPI0020BFCEDE|nr:hypothetical protein [Methylonatrum kenyense]MCK8515734.1 hypothetical protein [Methylonatrum kenyense]